MASSSMSTGRFPGIIDKSQRSSQAAQTNPQTTRSSQKSKFRSRSARPRRGTDTRVCTPTPILPLPQLHPSLSDAGAVPAMPGPARPGPTAGGRRRGRPSRRPRPPAGLKEERPVGSQPSPASSREPGAGGASAPGLPPPPGPASRSPLPRHRQTKGPTASEQGGGRGAPASSA